MAQLQIRGNTQIKIGSITEDRLAFGISTQAELDALANGAVATNSTNITTNTADIVTNGTAIGVNAGNITTNTTNIATNTTDIATNASSIATNVTAIATNTTDIATNVTAISNLDTATMKKASNLSDVVDVAVARTNLDVDSSAEVQTKIDNAGLALGTNYSVATIAARDALSGLTVGDNVFVTDA